MVEGNRFGGSALWNFVGGYVCFWWSGGGWVDVFHGRLCFSNHITFLVIFSCEGRRHVCIDLGVGIATCIERSPYVNFLSRLE